MTQLSFFRLVARKFPFTMEHFYWVTDVRRTNHFSLQAAENCPIGRSVNGWISIVRLDSAHYFNTIAAISENCLYKKSEMWFDSSGVATGSPWLPRFATATHSLGWLETLNCSWWVCARVVYAPAMTDNVCVPAWWTHLTLVWTKQRFGRSDLE